MIGYFMCLVDILCGFRLLWPLLNKWQKQTAVQGDKWKEILGLRINKMLNSSISVGILFFFS